MTSQSKILFFDLESDGLLETISVLHCIVIDDGETVTRYRPRYTQQAPYVDEAVTRLMDALKEGDYICGHNIIDYDIPAISKVVPEFKVERHQRNQVLDTLVLGRLCYSNIGDIDWGLIRQNRIPARLQGRHSLESWGYRLGELKGNYAKETEDAWACFTEEMLEYCVQDVKVTRLLYEKCLPKLPSELSSRIEHDAQWLMTKQEENGFPFNKKKALKLEKTLRTRQEEVLQAIRKTVPFVPDKVMTPKRNNNTKGYQEDCPFTKIKEFNPSSRDQISWYIRENYGYSPMNPKLYDYSGKDEDFLTGRLKVDEVTFSFIKNDPQAPEEIQQLSELFSESLLLTKRLGQLADGKNGWLKVLKEDGHIHGRVNPNGAVTGRSTHSNPNMAQVPSIDSSYGYECRELFEVPKGWLQCGVDASSLELRCLGHFMSPYDKGAYAREVILGNIHTINQEAAGLPSKAVAKRWIYAFLYGAGEELLGEIAGGDRKLGRKLKKNFLAKTPALQKLIDALVNTLVKDLYHGKPSGWKRKYLKGMDGRQLHVRSIHAVLNLLLQSAGALICKMWIIRWEQLMVEKGYRHGWDGDFAMMAHIHDEFQAACRTRKVAEDCAKLGQEAMRDVAQTLNFRVQLDTEAKIGKNWAECH